MVTTRICRLVVAALGAIALLLGTSPAALAAPEREPVPSFEEFAAETFRDIDGMYVVNGDEVIGDEASLRVFFDSMIAGTGVGTPDGLIVNTVRGATDRWSAGQVANMTYCVSTRFGSNYNALVAAMSRGAGLWESASRRVNFVHVTSQDGNCRTTNNSVLFSVEPTTTTQYIARAFFPSTPDAGRNVLVNARSLLSSGSWTPGNIMGHELGHTLGFRHEHTRPESGTCFEDRNWRPLTPYDSASIMHYPQCNGSSSNLSFTPTDGVGARALYGS